MAPHENRECDVLVLLHTLDRLMQEADQRLLIPEWTNMAC